VQRYSLEFKLKAVKLSQLRGVEVQAVADALEIHPFMLSRWRKEARDGRDITGDGRPELRVGNGVGHVRLGQSRV
jgi:transposase